MLQVPLTGMQHQRWKGREWDWGASGDQGYSLGSFGNGCFTSEQSPSQSCFPYSASLLISFSSASFSFSAKLKVVERHKKSGIIELQTRMTNTVSDGWGEWGPVYIKWEDLQQAVFFPPVNSLTVFTNHSGQWGEILYFFPLVLPFEEEKEISSSWRIKQCHRASTDEKNMGENQGRQGAIPNLRAHFSWLKEVNLGNS